MRHTIFAAGSKGSLLRNDPATHFWEIFFDFEETQTSASGVTLPARSQSLVTAAGFQGKEA